MTTKTTARIRRKAISRLRAAGVTLVEVALVMAVIAVMLAAISNQLAQDAQRTKDMATAERMREVYDAAREYVQANYGTIDSNGGDTPEVEA